MHFLDSIEHIGLLPGMVSRTGGHILSCTLTIPWIKQPVWVVRGTSTVSELLPPTKHEAKPVDSGHKKF